MTVWNGADFGSHYKSFDRDVIPENMRCIIMALYSEASAQSRILNDLPELIVENQYDSQYFVGTFAVFSNNPVTTGCEKCKVKETDNKIDSVKIPLTVALLERLGKNGNRSTLDPENIGPYLKKNLKWHLTLANGGPVPLEDVPSLRVETSTKEVALGGLDRNHSRRGPGLVPHMPQRFPEYKPAK